MKINDRLKMVKQKLYDYIKNIKIRRNKNIINSKNNNIFS